jgi:hypothetical protein
MSGSLNRWKKAFIVSLSRVSRLVDSLSMEPKMRSANKWQCTACELNNISRRNSHVTSSGLVVSWLVHIGILFKAHRSMLAYFQKMDVER